MKKKIIIATAVIVPVAIIATLSIIGLIAHDRIDYDDDECELF